MVFLARQASGNGKPHNKNPLPKKALLLGSAKPGIEMLCNLI